eukprot:COSAG05_NODE_2525_length_2946_cov_2.038637_1_plen_783_part_00
MVWGGQVEYTCPANNTDRQLSPIPSGPLPVCEGNPCLSTLSPRPYGLFSTVCAEGQMIPHGEKCELLCAPGYIAFGEAASCNHADLDTGTQECFRQPHSTDVYVKWGSDQPCGAGDQTLYSGVAVTARSTESGGGANRLCLPAQPASSAGNKGNDRGSQLSSVEWETEVYKRTTYGFLASMNRYTVLCSVCAREKVSGMILWGSKTCPERSTLEFSGAVMADLSKPNPLECVPQEDAIAKGNDRINYGGRLSLVETADGAAPMYYKNFELACSRCSAIVEPGASYTRWGNEKCPDHAKSVYTGYIVGSLKGQSSYICLNSDDESNKFASQNQRGPEVYRVQYKWHTDAVNDGERAVCSSCRAIGRQWSLMIPGRSDCENQALTTDYSGYLMAERSVGRSQFICVDSTAKGIPVGSASGTQFALLYPVETNNGGIPSYADNLELTCAQCSSNAGPTYVRWGRTTCPSAATIMYAGIAAGSDRVDNGGGFNLQCLHGSPEYGNSDNATVNANTAKLYRAEYATNAAASGRGLWQLWHLHNRDMPCVVCQSTGSLAVYMQPGDPMCPSGWSTEYSGFVMSSPLNTRRSEYVCVDKDAEAATEGDNILNTKSAQLSPVEVLREDGDLLESYSSYAELGCSVCSQPNPKITCPQLTAPSGGSLTCTNEFRYASACSYACEPAFVLTGGGTAVCGDDGQWIGAASVTCSAPSVATTAVYTRWGSDSCDPLDSALYAGRAAGPRSTSAGGANPLCLPATISEAASKIGNAAHDGGSDIAGLEYYTNAVS